MFIEAQYNWLGELTFYRQENTFIPCDPNNSDFKRIQMAISQGACEVVEPKLGVVCEAYDRKQEFSGYVTRFGFASIDQDNRLFRLVKEQIANGTCSIAESSRKPVEAELKIDKLLLCTFFEQPWPHLTGPFSGELAYTAHKSCAERNYRFTIKNLPSAPNDKLQLLLADYRVNIGFQSSCFPIRFGVIEIEVPVLGLKHLFMGERKLVPSWMASALTDTLNQHYAQTRRKQSEGPDISWLIEHIGLYSGHFFVEFTNHVIDAFKREYGDQDQPMPYLTEGNTGSNPIVIGCLEDGRTRLQSMFPIPNQSYGLAGEWDKGSLGRYQDATKSSGFLYQTALSRVSEMVRLGFHPEALATLNAYLEVVIQSTLVRCVSDDRNHKKIVGRLGHKKRLDILSTIAESKHEPILSDNDLKLQVASAVAIYKNRNSCVHDLKIPDVDGRMKLEDRRKMEALFQGFLDHFEQNQFLMRLQAIAENSEVIRKIVIRAIQERK